MPTIVDSLLVTLSLDPTNFTKGQKQAASDLLKVQAQSNRTAKEMEADGARASQFFSKVKTEALGLIGVLLGGKGIETFARDATKSLADLGREAKNIGVGVPELAALSNALERNGGSAETARKSLEGYAAAKQEWLTKGDNALPATLGVFGADINDGPLQVLMKFQKFIQDNKDKPNGIQRIQQVGTAAGYDQGMINAMVQIGTVTKMNEELAESYRNGVPTQDMIDRVTAMQHSFTGLGQAAEHAGDLILAHMAPGLTALSGDLTALIDQYPTMVPVMAGITGYLTTMAALNFRSVIGFLGDLAPALALAAIAIEEMNDTQRHPEAEQFFGADGNQSNGPWRNWLQLNAPTWLGGTPDLADTTMAPEQSSFLRALSKPESGGDYTIKNGGSHFTDFSQFPEGVGTGGTSTASGRYQFTSETWRGEAAKLGLKDFSPANQDRAAWDLASTEYKKKTDRDLQADLKSGGHDWDIEHALAGRWPSLIPTGRGNPNAYPHFAPDAPPHPAGAPPPGAPPIAAPSATPPSDPRSSPSGWPQFPSSAVPVPVVPRAAPPPAAPITTGDASTSITIGSISVQTAATDSKGIAGSLRRAVADTWTTQANRGLA